MAGRGLLHEVEPIRNKDILMFRSNSWVTAEEPLHTDKPEWAGIGLGMSFAETLQKKLHARIGLIPCAYGGTSLSEWQKGGSLYANAVASTLEALKNSTLKGVLWHQGECDSDTLETAESYKERFLPFMDSLLADIGAVNVPVVLGELGEFLAYSEECSYSTVINEQLADIVHLDRRFALVSAKGLTDRGDSLHFNSISLREFGIRYAAALEESGIIV